jgi:alkanesulfonate monooxygenase SsuD/methylene tetrahydromethanopterin reductase-like flavin-dependent oxidoreductase (luciferase family)
VRAWTAPLIRGEPDHVRAELEALAQRTGTDELMITTMIHGAQDRMRSYELLADAWHLTPVAAGVPEASG